uniref:Uncharacterized protein n=1 Tax=Onchocerca volvulus TaxID=6282 RepID=A0A8R1TNI8_ONCVO
MKKKQEKEDQFSNSYFNAISLANDPNISNSLLSLLSLRYFWIIVT